MSQVNILVHGRKLTLTAPVDEPEERTLMDIWRRARCIGKLDVPFVLGLESLMVGIWWSIEAEEIVKEHRGA